jgi:glutamate-ammonia-ligase adenylyltransferase
MREAHDLLTRLLVVLRLVVPDGGEPPRANHDLVAAACGAPSWPALLAELAEARQEVAAWWSEVGEQR